MKHYRLLSLLCLLCFLISVSGCGLRPSEQVVYLTVSAGTPMLILESSKDNKGQDFIATGRDLKSGTIIKQQKINGWMAMPPDHWSIVKAKLEGVSKYEAEHGLLIPPLAQVVPVP